NVITAVKNVTITGFRVSHFAEAGILAIGAENARFLNNLSFADGGYGLAAFVSTGTHVEDNIAHDNGEAGIYIGDSPNADAAVRGNNVHGNLYGIFVRDASHGTL